MKGIETSKVIDAVIATTPFDMGTGCGNEKGWGSHGVGTSATPPLSSAETVSFTTIRQRILRT